MASFQVTLTGGTPVLVGPLDTFTGRIVVTIMSAPAEVWVTADGSLPQVPTSTELTGNQISIAGVTGAQGVVQPALFGDHMAVATLRLISTGTPVVEVRW